MAVNELKGLDAATRAVTGLQKQVKFATAQALNDTARGIQQDTVGPSGRGGYLADKFTLRSKGPPWQRPGAKFGFNAKFASKNKLEARVGSQADWLREQERGGIKQVSGGHRAAIPTAFWKARHEIMAKEKKPRAILKNLQADLRRVQSEAAQTHKLNKKGNMILKSQRTRMADIRRVNAVKKQIQVAGSLSHTPFIPKGNNPKAGIYVRTSNNRLPIKMLFTFESGVRIRAILQWEPRAKQIAMNTYEKNFAKRITEAILTAK